MRKANAESVIDVPNITSWQDLLYAGVERMLQECVNKNGVDKGHVKDTPKRIVKMYSEIFSGCDQDPAEVLNTAFDENGYNEMIVQQDITFNSWCAHHLVPFVGKVHFGYLPNGRIVGLSKIARVIDILSRRPQIQEKLTEQIAKTFFEKVQPNGCGVVVVAEHMCMSCRGVKKAGSPTKTAKLMGVFEKPEVKSEFFSHIAGH